MPNPILAFSDCASPDHTMMMHGCELYNDVSSSPGPVSSRLGK